VSVLLILLDFWVTILNFSRDVVRNGSSKVHGKLGEGHFAAVERKEVYTNAEYPRVAL